MTWVQDNRLQARTKDSCRTRVLKGESSLAMQFQQDSASSSTGKLYGPPVCVRLGTLLVHEIGRLTLFGFSSGCILFPFASIINQVNMTHSMLI